MEEKKNTSDDERWEACSIWMVINASGDRDSEGGTKRKTTCRGRPFEVAHRRGSHRDALRCTGGSCRQEVHCAISSIRLIEDKRAPSSLFSIGKNVIDNCSAGAHD